MGPHVGPVSLLLLPIYLVLLRECSGGRVLMYLPVATRSHLVAWYPLAGALAQNGHEVTFVTGYPSPDLPASVDQLAVDNSIFHEYQETFTQAMLENPGIWSVLLSIPDGWDAVLQTHRRALNHPRLKKILNESNSDNWDLVIASPFLNEAGVMLADYLRAPMILYLPANAGEFLSLSLGHPDSLAWSGAAAGSLKGRINNLLVNMVYGQFIKPYYFVQPQNSELIRHIPNYTVASYKDLERNADFAFYFSSPHLGNLAPRLPNTANTAFIHCRKGKPLKPEIESWINRSPANQSIVYMSMGSLVKFDHVPSKTVEIFEKVFEKLNVRVIWKRSGITSDRIFMTDWIDQQDILAHPRVNIFISLVGLMSIQESIYHEVPLLGIPLSFEQKMNADLIEKNNLGIVLDFYDITEASFTSALVHLQQKHHTYQTDISRLATRVKDSRITPLQDAVWWCEYVMRNKGGHQLLSDYRHLSLVKFYCLDIILLVTVVLSVLLVQLLFSAKVLYVSLKYLISLRPFARICQLLFGPGRSKQTKKNL